MNSTLALVVFAVLAGCAVPGNAQTLSDQHRLRLFNTYTREHMDVVRLYPGLDERRSAYRAGKGPGDDLEIIPDKIGTIAIELGD